MHALTNIPGWLWIPVGMTLFSWLQAIFPKIFPAVRKGYNRREIPISPQSRLLRAIALTFWCAAAFGAAPMLCVLGFVITFLWDWHLFRQERKAEILALSATQPNFLEQEARAGILAFALCAMCFSICMLVKYNTDPSHGDIFLYGNVGLLVLSSVVAVFLYSPLRLKIEAIFIAVTRHRTPSIGK